MFIGCSRCGNNAALRMTGTNGRTYAKCLECGEEMLVGVPRGVGAVKGKGGHSARRDADPVSNTQGRSGSVASTYNYHPHE
jgi:hypothetical protein